MTEGDTGRDLLVTRYLEAPVEQVWRAWSAPEHLMRWWRPTGLTSPLARMAFCEEGLPWCARAPLGSALFSTWAYEKMASMRRIEFVHRFAGKDGPAVDPARIVFLPEIPRGVPHVVTQEARGGNRTRMTVTEHGHPSGQIVAMSRAGMEQSLDKKRGELRNGP